jgi:membrane fusion protein, copper/silver efflux system
MTMTEVHSSPIPQGRFGATALLAAALAGAVLSGSLVHFWRAHEPSGAAAEEHAAAHKYQCPMHPAVVQDHPGNCPICGMKLVPITSPTPAPPAPKDAEGASASTSSAVAPQGLSKIEIDAQRQQLIGLKTVEVTRGAIGGSWRSVGRVAIDETRVRHVNLKVGGFVERIFVDFVGKRVRVGDPLFALYSPELLAAQEEYLLALRMSPGAVDPLVAAARRKLSLWDVPDSQLDELKKTREPRKTLTFHSPLSGVVTKKDVVQGMRLEAGAMPYEIVDLSSVWVLVDVYETDLRVVKEGLAAKLKLNAFPEREFTGKVVFIDPLLDPRSRTVKVRLTFPNPTGELKPEMFGEAELLGPARDALIVPRDAVIDSGMEKIVFVALGAGKFEPRKVELGVSDQTRAEVTSGVELGERVVTRANFLVDSESRLRASLTEATGQSPGPESARVMPAVAAPTKP